jgi:hypothetical protein
MFFSKIYLNKWMTGWIFFMTGNKNSMTGNKNYMTGNKNYMTGNKNYMTGNKNYMTGRSWPVLIFKYIYIYVVTGAGHDPITGWPVPVMAQEIPDRYRSPSYWVMTGRSPTLRDPNLI